MQHPNYSTVTKRNDIGLIRLLKVINFLDGISPACLQLDLRDEKPDVEMIITGWGSTSIQRNR